MIRNVYFDNAATTPIRKEVIEVMYEVLKETFGNPSSTHAFGRSAKTQIETARKVLQNILMLVLRKLFLLLEERNQIIC